MDVDEPKLKSEQALIQHLLAGESEAVADLIRLYADDVYRFIYNHVGGIVQDAEDLTQETFIAALQALTRFRGDSKLRTWLFSIAAHKVKDRHRYWMRRPQTDLYPIAFSLLSDAPLPERTVERLELSQELRFALLQLPVHYRTALILKYIEDMSVKEIAQVMQRSLKSVESILVRARRSLAKLLEGDHERS